VLTFDQTVRIAGLARAASEILHTIANAPYSAVITRSFRRCGEAVWRAARAIVMDDQNAGGVIRDVLDAVLAGHRRDEDRFLKAIARNGNSRTLRSVAPSVGQGSNHLGSMGPG